MLMAACRYSYRPTAAACFFENELHCEPHIKLGVSEGLTIEDAAERSIVVRWPSHKNGDVTRKGVVIITFTKTSSFFLRNVDLKSLQQLFHIVLEPSWAGYLDPDILQWANELTAPVFVQSTELTDRAYLAGTRGRLVPLTFGAGDWVDSKFFAPRDSRKSFDSIYVANTNPVKRVTRYLKAIDRLKETAPDYRACLVCAGWGDSARQIEALAAPLVKSGHLDLFFKLPQAELIELIVKSKVNVLLSFKEGSNRSLFESMFCDVPALCIAENVGTNKQYFNEFSGAVVPDSLFEHGLLMMREQYSNFKPRDWAETNIDPAITTRKLAHVIANYFPDESGDDGWLVKVNAPEVRYRDFPLVEMKQINSGWIEALTNASVPEALKSIESSRKLLS